MFTVIENKEGQNTHLKIEMEWKIRGGAKNASVRRLLIHVRSLAHHTFEAIDQMLEMGKLKMKDDDDERLDD